MTESVWTNIAGTISAAFTIGAGGPTILQGSSLPTPDLGQDGDLYVRGDPVPGLYQKSSGAWGLVTANFVRQSVAQGSNATVLDNASYVGVVTGSAGPTQLALPAGSLYQQITVKDEAGQAGTYPVTVTTTTLIDGASSYVVARNFGSLTVMFNGQDWFIVRSV